MRLKLRECRNSLIWPLLRKIVSGLHDMLNEMDYLCVGNKIIYTELMVIYRVENDLLPIYLTSLLVKNRVYPWLSDTEPENFNTIRKNNTCATNKFL